VRNRRLSFIFVTVEVVCLFIGFVMWLVGHLSSCCVWCSILLDVSDVFLFGCVCVCRLICPVTPCLRLWSRSGVFASFGYRFCVACIVGWLVVYFG